MIRRTCSIGFLTALSVVLLTGCASNMTGNYINYDVKEHVISYFQVTDVKGNLTGTAKETKIDTNDFQLKTSSTTFTGQHNGNSFSIKFGEISWLSSNISGEFKRRSLILSNPDTTDTFTLKHSNQKQYLKDVSLLKEQVPQIKVESMHSKLNDDIANLNSEYASLEETLASAQKDLETTKNDTLKVQKQEKEFYDQVKKGTIGWLSAFSKEMDIQSGSNQVGYDLKSDQGEFNRELDSLTEIYNTLTTDEQKYRNLYSQLPKKNSVKSFTIPKDLNETYHTNIKSYDSQMASILKQGEVLETEAQSAAKEATKVYNAMN